jgi:hypothetical protein
LSQTIQGRLRRYGATVELTVDESSVERYSPDSNDVSTEAEESALLKAVARERLLKHSRLGKAFAGAVVICELLRLQWRCTFF